MKRTNSGVFDAKTVVRPAPFASTDRGTPRGLAAGHSSVESRWFFDGFSVHLSVDGWSVLISPLAWSVDAWARAAAGERARGGEIASGFRSRSFTCEEEERVGLTKLASFLLSRKFWRHYNKACKENVYLTCHYHKTQPDRSSSILYQLFFLNYWLTVIHLKCWFEFKLYYKLSCRLC